MATLKIFIILFISISYYSSVKKNFPLPHESSLVTLKYSSYGLGRISVQFLYFNYQLSYSGIDLESVGG